MLVFQKLKMQYSFVSSDLLIKQKIYNIFITVTVIYYFNDICKVYNTTK